MNHKIRMDMILMSKRNKAFSIFMAFAFSSIILGAAAASSSVCWLKKRKEASGDFITLSSHNDFLTSRIVFIPARVARKMEG